MMKKLAVLVLALLFLLTACGQKDTSSADTPQETDAAVETQNEGDATVETPDEDAAAVEEPQEEDVQTGDGDQIANPWREVGEEEAKSLCANSFNVPEGAENVVWSVMDSAADPSGVPGALVQVNFDLDGLSYTAREQVTGDEELDQSGMYYDWTISDSMTLQNWRDGQMTGTYYRFVGEGEYADLCTWYDVEVGISYSLSVVAADLDGFDLQAIVEAMA